MPTPRKKSTAKSKAAPKAKTQAAPSMPDGQKAIYSKLKKKGLSEKQALALSKNAHKRKVSAAAKKPSTTSVKRPSSTGRRGKR